MASLVMIGLTMPTNRDGKKNSTPVSSTTAGTVAKSPDSNSGATARKSGRDASVVTAAAARASAVRQAPARRSTSGPDRRPPIQWPTDRPASTTAMIAVQE